MDIKELALRTVEAMQVYGLSPRSAWDEYSRTYIPIIKLHESKGQKDFSREIISEHVRQTEGRFERGEIKICHYRSLKRAAQRLTEVHDTGKLDWSAPKMKSGFHLNEYYENILIPKIYLLWEIQSERRQRCDMSMQGLFHDNIFMLCSCEMKRACSFQPLCQRSPNKGFHLCNACVVQLDYPRLILYVLCIMVLPQGKNLKKFVVNL